MRISWVIGYSPDREIASSNEKGAHQLEVKVKKPGLEVRYRSSFYGLSETEKSVYKTPEEKVIAFLKSPFNKKDELKTKLTPLFTYDKKDGININALLTINSKDLSFIDEPEDTHKALIDIVIVAYNAKGQTVGQNTLTHTITVKKETYHKMIEQGFAIFNKISVKEPGIYQVRAVVHDKTSNRVGATHQVIEVPSELKKGKLSLSGIFLTRPEIAVNQLEETEPTESDLLLVSSNREFKSGETLQYTFNTYNFPFANMSFEKREKS